MSVFDEVELAPEDPILNLNYAFKEDPRKKKINLGVGSYKDSEGHPVVFTTVEKVEKLILEQKKDKEYPPIPGVPEYISESLKLIFGEQSQALKENRIFAAQTLGGTGALRIGGEFLAEEIRTDLYLSDPTWPNHRAIFEQAGLNVKSYPYYDNNKNALDFDAMCESFKSMPPKSIVLLHACCHNPTGMDPSFDQWKSLSDLLFQHKLIPFFDFAYQGFDQDPEKDAKTIRYFVDQGHEMLVASSNSKNFGLYGERVGLLSVVAADEETSKKIGSRIKQLIRSNYSMPPIHGAKIVAAILSSSELKKEWQHELSNITLRIKEMRKSLVAGLLAKSKDIDFDFIHRQTGMFSYSGLNPDQTHRLRQDYGVYMTSKGRINIAGLNWNNLDYVVDAIVAVHES